MAMTSQGVNEAIKEDLVAAESNEKLATTSNGPYCRKCRTRISVMSTTATTASKSTTQAEQEPAVSEESEEDTIVEVIICDDHTPAVLFKPLQDRWVDSFQITDGLIKNDFVINSRGLQAAFRSVVKLCPCIDMDGPAITIPSPYIPLYYYFDKICAAAENNPDVPAEELEMLKGEYTKWMLPAHEKIRNMISQGQIQFNSLWALFRPGDLIYTCDDARRSRLFVLVTTQYRPPSNGGPILPNANISFPRLCADLWSVDWDCVNQEFQRFRSSNSIRSFIGQCSITSLPFYPLSFYKDGNEAEIDKLLSGLEERGRCWKGLVTQPPCCRHYCGPAWDLSNLGVQFVDERVVIDVTPTLESPGATPRILGLEGGRLLPTVMSRTVGSRSDVKDGLIGPTLYVDSYSEYDDVPPDREFEPLQAQLCPAVIRCFAIKSRRWFNVEIGKLTEVLWAKTAFDHLVLDESTKSMLASLVERHHRNRGDVLSDVIPSKSRGLAIVLHGPPGVGKTLTAETIAERTQKILLQIDMGELTAESNMVNSLRRIFDSAARWDAVLLLDEADVLLEKRSFEDLQRNGIVSMFLRMIEYFDGVIFMTTNRIETMDVAFQSRIHVAIKYPPTSPPFRRQIWERFIQRLDEREVEAKRELGEHLDDLEHWELNGRQIRNVLSIAESIALNKERRRGALRYRHVEEVANATLDFQHFFDDTARDRKSQVGDIGSRQFQERRGKNFSGRWG